MSVLPPLNKSKWIVGQNDSCCACYSVAVNASSISMLNDKAMLHLLISHANVGCS